MLVPVAKAACPDGHGGLDLSPARKPWLTTASCWSPSAAMPGTRTGPVSTARVPHPKIPRRGPKYRLSWLNIPAAGDAPPPPPQMGQSWVGAGFGEAGPATDRFWDWDSKYFPPASPWSCCQGRAWCVWVGGGASTASSPEAPRQPDEARRGEQSRVIHGRWHFPATAEGMWERTKRAFSAVAGMLGRQSRMGLDGS